MPMIDLYIPEGALKPEAEAQLMRELTDILITAERVDNTLELAREFTWIFLHRPAACWRNGAPVTAPIYRIVPTVPEGQYDDENRPGLVKEVIAAVARAEGVPVEQIYRRVWVFPTEVFEGGWGSRGGIQRLPAIMEFFGGTKRPDYKAEGAKRIAKKRKQDVVDFLEKAIEVVKSK